MNTKSIIIESPMSTNELAQKLNSMTVTEFSDFQNSPGALYYGEIKTNTFNIKNVRYGPMSSAPFLEGEISGDVTHSTVTLKIDIESHYTLLRKMYFTTLIPIGIIVMLLSVLVFAGTEYQVQGFVFASAFILCAFAFVGIMKAALINMKNQEVKKFTSTINGKVINDVSSIAEKQAHAISEAA